MRQDGVVKISCLEIFKTYKESICMCFIWECLFSNNTFVSCVYWPQRSVVGNTVCICAFIHINWKTKLFVTRAVTTVQSKDNGYFLIKPPFMQLILNNCLFLKRLQYAEVFLTIFFSFMKRKHFLHLYFKIESHTVKKRLKV